MVIVELLEVVVVQVEEGLQIKLNEIFENYVF
jgi:hypothetical protein